MNPLQEQFAPVVTITVPNPFFEGDNRVYVIETSPLTVIDTGIATSETFAAIESELAERGFSVDDVGTVVLTHKHIDHIGNAWRFQQRSGARVLVHFEDEQSLARVDPDGTRYAEFAKQRFEEWAIPEALVNSFTMPRKEPWEIEDCHVTGIDGDTPVELSHGRLDVIHTPGHTMGSICLKYGRYLFTGDHILQKISPNIGIGDMRRQGLLEHYLNSLQRIDHLPPEELIIMPGHGDSFTGCAKRISRLERHHQRRLAKITRMLDPQAETSVYDLADQIFGELPGFHMALACAEVHSHLEYLEGRNTVCSKNYRYRRA